jgi:glycosyltransferase involved in cell wall biosynthesis
MGSLLPSGMERMFVSAAPYFLQAGVENVLVGQGNDQRFVAELEQAGYRVRVIPPVKTASGARAWGGVLRAEQPDLVHIHDEAAIVVSAPAARAILRGVPVVRSIHNEFQPTGRALLSRKVQGYMSNWVVAATIAVSPGVQRNELRFGRRARVVLNWVDDRFWDLRDQRAALVAAGGVENDAVVMVGNCSPIKNHVLALRAVAPTSLAVYFHGDERFASPEEEALLDRLEQEGRLRHRGTGDPGSSLVRAARFLMPSRHEGMSIALAEALAVGLPAFVNEHAGSDWAASFPAMTYLPNEQTAWDRAVRGIATDDPATAASSLPEDLSAARGVRELLGLYREVRSRRRGGPSVTAA